MRIDREAFLLAVAALAGCERAEPPAPPPSRVARIEAQRPAAAREIYGCLEGFSPLLVCDGRTMDTGDELRAAIDAAPDDDEVRRVYADWLLERGDSRGELIHLQLAPERDEDRVRALIEEHRDALLGPFAGVASAHEISRGFLTSVTVGLADLASVDAIPRLDRFEVNDVGDDDLLSLLTTLQPRRELVLNLRLGATAYAEHARSGEPWDVLLAGVFEGQGFNIDNALSGHPTIVRYVNR